MPTTTKTIIPANPAKSGLSLYIQVINETTGALANAAEENLTETANGVYSATVTVDSAITGWHRLDCRRQSDDSLAFWQYGLMDDSTVIGRESAVVTDTDGTGARTVTITVNDGSTALQSARVRLTQGGESLVQSTNASGIATFNVDDATWTVAIAKANYSFAGASLVVNGDEAQTYSMTAVSITPPTNPSLSAIEVLCIDEEGQPESGVAVDIRIHRIPSGSQNMAFKGSKKTATSDGDGVARFEVVQGGTYEWKRGTHDTWTSVTIDNDGVTNVTSVIGSP